jgi:hypothetical protein
MRTRLLSLLLPILIGACAASMPPPSERLATAEAAARSAKELGAEKDPKAALHLKLAQEQIDQAKGLMKEENNVRADQILQRAHADAELSVALAKEATVNEESAKAKEKLKAVKGGK